MLRRLTFLGTLAATAACGGCGDGTHTPLVTVTELEVTNEQDFSALDVEVHLFDENTQAHLGCSGRDQGMEPVDASDIAYQLDALFIHPTGSAFVEADELRGRSIEMIVIEDDALPCPEPPGPDDDVIGLASGLGFSDFDAGSALTFDDVVAIRVQFD